jgi:branched-chain amino acid transport system ATP-binding protein
MTPAEIQDANRLIMKIRDRGVTVLLTEHHMSLVMQVSDRITVLNYGRKIAEGRPETVRQDAEVLAAYLGAEA